MKISTTVFLLGLLICSSCSKKVIMGPVEAYEVATHQDGTMKVKSWVVGNEKNASYNAAQNALEKVLFQGVPGTAVKRPLYKGDRAVHQTYFDDLIKSPYNYVSVGTNSSGDRINTSEGIKVGIVCSVYYKKLRMRLESDNIIKAMSEW